MCGRFALNVSPEEVKKAFNVSGDLDPKLSYNIPPGQTISAVRRLDSSSDNRELAQLKWGLVPHWADDTDIGNKLINARAETVDEKPSFRNAFRKRRCLIPASGFYEWKKENESKQPYYIYPDDGNLFGFAGLWERWEDENNGGVLESCTILTTAPNRMMKQIHGRMPVILHPSRYDAWLDPERDADDLSSFLTPYQSAKMASHPVSKHVNNPENDDPSCVESIEE